MDLSAADLKAAEAQSTEETATHAEAAESNEVFTTDRSQGGTLGIRWVWLQ